MLASYFGSLRTLNRNVLLYLAATALLGFTIDGGIYSVLFNLFLVRLGYGPEFIGQINAAGLLAFALASLPAGALGGAIGLRRSLIIGLTVAIAGGLALPLATLFNPAHTSPILTGGFVAAYIGLSLYYVNAVPFMADIASRSERNTAFAMQTALLSLAGFTGALIGGFLPRLFATLLSITQQQPDPYRYPLFVAVAILIPAIGLIFSIKHSPVPEPDGPHRPSLTPVGRVESSILATVLLLSVVRFFHVSGVAVAGTFFNLYMDTALNVATMHIGIISGSARLIGFIAALVTPLVVTRWGAPRAILFASTVSAAGLIPLALIPVWPAAGLGFVGVVALSSMRYPAYMLFCMDVTPPRWRGMLAGLGETFGGLNFALLALAGGYIIKGQGFAALFLLGSGLVLVGNALFYLWFMLPRARRLPNPVT